MAERKVAIRVDLVPGDQSGIANAARKAMDDVAKDVAKAQDANLKALFKLDPGIVRQQVSADRDKADLEKLYKAAYGKEELKQKGIGGIFKEKGIGGVGEALGGGKGLGGYASGLAGLIGGEGAGKSVAGLAQGLEGLAGPIGLAVAAVGAAVTVFNKLAEAAIGFARVANPAAVERLDDAWKDLYGVIGQQTLPIVDVFTESVKLLGDVVKTAFDAGIVDGLKEVFSTIAFVIRSIREMLESIGVLSSARGSAARHASITNVGSYLSSAYTAAGSSGRASATSWLEKISGQIEGITGLIATGKQLGEAGGAAAGVINPLNTPSMLWHLMGGGAKANG